MLHLDFFGNQLCIGDIVAFNPPGYKDLTLGKVIKLTEKSVRLSYTRTAYYEKECETTSLKCDVIKKIMIGNTDDQ